MGLPKLISLVTINYNTPEITEDFLKSVDQLIYENFEVILIDNGSSKKINKDLELKYSWLKIIFSEKNLGFTGGNNLAFSEAQGEYILVINNDTEVPKDFLNILVAPFNNDPTIGIVCPKIVYFENPNLIQYAGYTAIHPITGRNSVIGGMEIDHGQYNISGFTEGAHGAAMLVKKEVINKVGVFYEPFFLYYEEVDWTYRIKRAGYKVYYEAGTKILHKESSSVGRLSSLKTYFMSRNRILFMKRNTKSTNFILFALYYSFVILPKSTISLLLENDSWSRLKSFWKGSIDGFKMKSK